jgi:hypothetical protein
MCEKTAELLKHLKRMFGIYKDEKKCKIHAIVLKTDGF